MNIPLIESMLLSKDEEVRKLAFNYIKTNYNIDFKIYYDESKFKCSLIGKSNDHFTFMEHMLNCIVKENPIAITFIQDAIKLILEYNEKYK